MYIAYVDESGCTGATARGGSKCYSLGCVLVSASQWPGVFDRLADYRQYLERQFGLLPEAELKANHLLRNSSGFRGLALSESARFAIYRGLLRLCPKLDVRVFATVIRKELMSSGDVHHLAWALLFERLERLTREEQRQVVVIHDEGHDMKIRALARQARREAIVMDNVGPHRMIRPFRGLLDDPVSRHSHESEFLQLADLLAYAAFRRIYPPPARPVQIVPQLMWEELGGARLTDVDERSEGGLPGIVIWPRLKRKEPSLEGSKGRHTLDGDPVQTSLSKLA